MRKLPCLILLLAAYACNNETKTSSASRDEIFSDTIQSGGNVAAETNNKKPFRKPAYIIDLSKNVFADKKQVSLWSNVYADKQNIYTLEPHEEVIVYGAKGDYLYVAPKKDTSKIGYILKGFIEPDSLLTVTSVVPEETTYPTEATPRYKMEEADRTISKKPGKATEVQKQEAQPDILSTSQTDKEPERAIDTIPH